MKKFIIRIICCVIPSKKLSHKIRTLCSYNNTTANNSSNSIKIIKKDGTVKTVDSLPNSNIVFNGDNNHILLYEPLGTLSIDANLFGNTNITLYGSNGKRTIKIIHEKGTRPSKLYIGNHLTTNTATIIELGSGTTIHIGDDCTFSWDVMLRSCDWHPIYDRDTKELQNKNKSIYIGNHVWLSSSAWVSKGAYVPDDCVVGERALVTKAFTTPNCVIAGIPAKVVRTNIEWFRNAPNDREIQ